MNESEKGGGGEMLCVYFMLVCKCMLDWAGRDAGESVCM